ncbi:MAG: M3 family metallopeptidase [Verrucomicrobiota bacterium JB022]|nr:M3 family metallopeptidase [Verrucomicrobiota bacterium JB022]
MEHPFLDDRLEIRWSQLTPERVQPDIELALKQAQAAVDNVAARDPLTLTFENTYLALEAGTEQLSHAWGLVSHLDSVRNSPELRKAYNAMLPAVTAFYARIPLNDALYQTLKAYAESRAAAGLNDVQRRYVNETLADFRESGAELPPEKKERLEQIENELSSLTQKFSENDLDSTNAYEKIVTDESLLAGLPASAKEAARESALRKGHGTEEAPQWRFTLQAPSFMPAMKYIDSEALRQELYEAFARVASEGEHDNTPILRSILKLRQEKAALLGKAHFADVVLERRMARQGEAALAFVEDLHRKTKPAFDQENDELEIYRAEQTGTDKRHVKPWEGAYWAEKLRRERYDFDEEELRPYFPITRVVEGLYSLVEKVFGVRITERTGVDKPEVWHEDVEFYDLHDGQTGQHLGSFYADWFPREDKRSGAWMNHLRTGERPRGDGKWTPHLGLMAGNLTPPSGGKPALLTHRDVETVFHEFGHLLHHLLGEVEVKALNGTNVAWDFVELPSQIMENWCWERESLDLFARHYETGEPIPAELFAKTKAARNFFAARFQMRQLCLGKMDLEMHLHAERFLEGDLDAQLDDVLRDYLVPTEPRSAHIIRQFSHLFSSPTGYAAGYYSYKWAEVLDADAFTRFQTEGLMSPAVGRAFREHVLSKGNSEDPAVLFRQFMGRDPDPQALLKRLGLVA